MPNTTLTHRQRLAAQIAAALTGFAILVLILTEKC